MAGMPQYWRSVQKAKGAVIGKARNVEYSCHSPHGDSTIYVHSSVEIRPRQRDRVKTYRRDHVRSGRKVLCAKGQSHQRDKTAPGSAASQATHHLLLLRRVVFQQFRHGFVQILQVLRGCCCAFVGVPAKTIEAAKALRAAFLQPVRNFTLFPPSCLQEFPT
jgi:hypothetical protein